MLEKIYYRVFEFIMLVLMIALFGLYIMYEFLRMIILSVVGAFQSIYQR